MSKHRAERVEELANALQAEGPDEYPTGYYRHLAEEQIPEEAVEEPEEVQGEPLDVKAITLPTAMCVRVQIEGIYFDVTIPHQHFGDLEIVLATFPAAFDAVLQGSYASQLEQIRALEEAESNGN